MVAEEAAEAGPVSLRAERQELVDWRASEPLAAAELANLLATVEEVFLLWASALAAAIRRASATREIVCRARRLTGVPEWEFGDRVALATVG